MNLMEAPLRELLITPSTPWRDVRCHEEVGSTNAVSLEDPRPWSIVTTRHQTSGRGRFTRQWESPVGASVAMSMTVPLATDMTTWGWLPLTTGLAVAEALGALTGSPDRFAVKWPNDVLARETEDTWGKVSGILCETAFSHHGHLAVVGVGVNITLRREDLPVPTATSLELAGLRHRASSDAAINGTDVVVAIAGAFARRHAQWQAGGADLAALQQDYRRICDTLGREVTIHLPDGTSPQGIAEDVDDSGEIVISSGTTRNQYAAGDVIHLRPASPEHQA